MTTTLNDVWLDAEKALLARMKATGGGSPYLSIICDVFGWCVAAGTFHDDGATARIVGGGDTPEDALRHLVSELASEQTHDELHEAIHDTCTKPIHEGDR